VYTPYPFYFPEDTADAPSPLAGIWRDSFGNFEGRVDERGHARMAWTRWDEELQQHTLVASEAFVVPRRKPGMGDRGFLSVRQLDSEGKQPIDRYALLEYSLDEDKLWVWLPHYAPFDEAIRDGDLEGAVFPERDFEFRAALVTSSKEALLEFLEQPRNTRNSGRYDSWPGGRLFGYHSPRALERVAADAKGSLNSNMTIVAGGDSTLKEPRPLARVERLELTGVGILSTTSERLAPADGPAGAVVLPEETPELQAETTRIPATVGTNFGVRFIPIGSPAGERVRLRRVWRMPAPGLVDPTARTPWFETEESVSCEIGRPCVLGWALRFDWELVPGTWTLEVWAGSRRLLMQSFELYPPEPVDR
jgi:hypothetical protein